MSKQFRYPRCEGPALGYQARKREMKDRRPVGQYPRFRPSHSAGWHACLKRGKERLSEPTRA